MKKILNSTSKNFILACLIIIFLISNAYSQDYNITKIPAKPESGFLWPYYLSIPSTLGHRAILLVIPNNTGTADDDPAVHDAVANMDAIAWSGFAGNLKSPLLIPTFPRPYTQWRIYTQALDRDSLLTEIEELKRIDLQLLSMIDDAIDRLLNMGIVVDEKVFMMGFSAAAMFTSRFSTIHPQRIKAAAIGASGYPIVPVESWEGEELRYCVGIADLYDLTGIVFDSETFKSIPMYFFVGDQDSNDPVAYNDGFDQEDRDLIYALFGDTVIGRWPKIQEVYNTVGCDSDFVIYKGVGHQFTTQMINDVEVFFKKVQSSGTGGSGGGGGGGGCFIATVAYGSSMAQEVKILKNFRDNVLLTNSIGKSIVNFYYKVSPHMVDFISKHDGLKALVRWSLLPIVGVSWMALSLGFIHTMVFILFMLALITTSVVVLFIRIRMQAYRT